MSLFKLLFGISKTSRKPKVAGSKDPNDHKKCALSTGWKLDDHYCSNCKKSTGHNEYITHCCNNCGEFGTQVRSGRTYRKIFIDDKWKYQIRYKRNNDEEIIEKWY